MPDVGQAAPELNLPSTNGETRTLASLRGQKVVLYFYPKDDTPGCTREACDFRDNLGRLSKAGAVVLGVSKDALASHEKFRGKYKLPFELLSDTDNTVAKSYGAYGQKMLYGKPIVGTIRSTFLIDEQGKVAAKWSPVKVDGHVDKVLGALGVSVPTASKPAAKETPAKKAPAKKKSPAKKKR
jgi:thioredoxin-dependent peroxiredoxin